jgi:hypothetical protein
VKGQIWDLLKYGRVVLVAPNQNLCNGSKGLDQEAPVVLRDGLVARKHIVQVFQVFQGMGVLGAAPTAAEPTPAAKHSDMTICPPSSTITQL